MGDAHENGNAPEIKRNLLGEEVGAHPGGFNASTGRPAEEGGPPPQYAFPPLTFDCIQGEGEFKQLRRKTRRVMVGNVPVGDGAPISVQTMTKCDPADKAGTLGEVLAMQDAGVDLIRVSLPFEWSVDLVQFLKSNGMTVPFIADVHFAHRIALKAIEAGVDKLRINPGNIEKEEYVRQIAREARDAGIAMRVGINSGSVPKDMLAKYNGHRIPAMVEGAMRHIGMLEEEGFTNIIVAVKASDVPTMIRAYRAMADATDYPLHLGVTESGTPWAGTIRSTAGMAALLADGIGDTIAGTAQAGSDHHQLPDMRADRDRCREDRRRGGSAGGDARFPAQGVDHGVCRERSGRSGRGRCRVVRGEECRDDLPRRRPGGAHERVRDGRLLGRGDHPHESRMGKSRPSGAGSA